ncbi:uncharacterized protein B0H64DRAFT_167135 [Chaetomium fimeti]|uniref:Uncharacterized protein n=1 Tax=Chaetomium fimeti TaxID=1854472 RepID=A0AAE0LSL1_9PEZI|nr:hypothetical protein B0H64DRAFT_167135 [Chaetomium fimeti]
MAQKKGYARSGSGSPGWDGPFSFLKPISSWGTGTVVSRSGFFLIFSFFTVHVLSPPRRFWDRDKVCKVCRYFPAGVLARLLTQVLQVFGLFTFFSMFPLHFHTG